MYTMPGEETVPFHLIWIGLALVYGFTRWRPAGMVTALVLVTVVTGLILAHHAAVGEIRWEETTEEPLMSAIFGVMVWHVNRRNQALAHVRRMADVERRRLEVQQMFVRLASHELRTPITVARGYTELVRRAHQDPATAEDTGIVLDELDKVGRITHRLVTLMQMEGPYQLCRTDLDAELVRVLRRWQPTADRRWQVHSSVGDVVVSPERLEAALDCLIENAVKFTTAGDRIELIGRRAAGTWVVEVRDSGSGFEPDQLPNLASGHGGEGTPTGTGLGLAIVRAVAAAHGGRAVVNSQPGEGTTVALIIPASSPAVNVPAPAAPVR
jgi:signal transduction histidine kinase